MRLDSYYSCFDGDIQLLFVNKNHFHSRLVSVLISGFIDKLLLGD